MALPRSKAPRRAVIYARISEDRAGARLGVERQAEDCRALADRLGWEVVATYEDNDISAFSGKARPGYKRMEAALADGMANAVLAWHPDRLHRSPRELEGFIDLLEKHHAQLATVQAGEIDLSTPSGRLVARQLGSVARYESEHKAERIRRAIAQRRDAGMPHAGRRPYGYEGTKPVPAEARHIRWAVKKLLDGATWNEVVRGLNDRGARTTEGNEWDRNGLQRILANPHIRGHLVHKRAIVRTDVWKGIITDAEWALLSTRYKRGTGASRTPYLLSGILRCGHCGMGLLHGSGRTKPRVTPPIYWCFPSPGGVRRGCGKTTILEPLADEAVTAAVLEALGDVPPMAGDQDDVQALEVELAVLRGRQQEIAAALADGSLSVAVATQADAQVNAEIETAERELASIVARQRVSGVAGSGIERMWPKLDVARRRAIISDVVDHVTVLPVGRGWHRPAIERLEIVWRN